MDDFHAFEQMKANGASAIKVCRTATANGVDWITKIRLLRQIFALSLVQAKEITIKATSGKSLDEYQAGLAEAIEEELNKQQKESV